MMKVRKPAGAKAAPKIQPDISIAWKNCNHEEDAVRKRIKEEGVQVAIESAEKISAKLRTAIHAITSDEDSADASIFGINEINTWLENAANLRKEHEDFKVYVGVAGATGVGKTSLLNALLGYHELLPSSSYEAATAVVCQIAWNEDKAPGKRFRAEVIFRSFADLKQELDHFFSELGTRKELEARGDNANVEDEDEQGGADLIEATLNLRDGFEKIKAIWGLNEDEVDEESTTTLLARNGDVTQHLGSTLTKHSDDAESFAQIIKPFLDSTPIENEDTGLAFAAWPLLERVNIYLEADILKNGLVLVDLPGLCDVVESRAAVAQSFYEQLTVTAVVSRITRAADEKSSVELMSKQQEMNMKLDGKFHKKSFCVVLTGMDDIRPNNFLKQQRSRAGADHELSSNQNELVELRKQDTADVARPQKIEKAKPRKAKRFLGAVGSKSKKSGVLKRQGLLTRATNEEMKQQALSAKPESRISKRARVKRMEDLERRITFWCMKTRNEIVKGRIEKDFHERQKIMAKGSQSDLYDGTINIFPVSSTAFWDLKENKHPIGFPSQRYTGIPALHEWIKNASLYDRERHLDGVLASYNVLLSGIARWSGNDFQGNELELDQEFIKKEVLGDPLEKLAKKLQTRLGQLKTAVNGIDPLKKKSDTEARCQSEVVSTVQNWMFKDPENPRPQERIHWLTYGANIRRNGGPYRSSSGHKIRYHWMLSLAMPFLQGMVDKWNTALHQNIPDLTEPTNKDIDKIWDGFLDTLDKKARTASPRIVPYLEKEFHALRDIRDEVKSKVKLSLSSMSKGATKARRELHVNLTEKWKPAFSKAASITGKGSFYQRRTILENYARQHRNTMYEKGSKDIEKNLERNKAIFRKGCKDIIEFARRRVREHVSILLNNVRKVSDIGQQVEETLNAKQGLQKFVRRISNQWSFKWRAPDATKDGVGGIDFSIPDGYHDLDGEVDQGESMDIDSSDEREDGDAEEGSPVKDEPMSD